MASEESGGDDSMTEKTEVPQIQSPEVQQMRAFFEMNDRVSNRLSFQFFHLFIFNF